MNVELLQKVAKHISEEPRRFIMDTFVDYADGLRDVCDLDAPNVPNHPFPKCGTAACIAGWTVLLMDGKEDAGNFRQRAMDHLQISRIQADRLFYTEDWPREFCEAYTNATTPTEKVNIAVARINYFIETDGKDMPK